MINRLKENEPIFTISKIRSILTDLGICLVEKWNNCEIEGIHSVRLTIAGTEIGTNGKGATELLALASGYGEFIERLANGILLASFPHNPKTIAFNSQLIPFEYFLQKTDIVDAILFQIDSSSENNAKGFHSYWEIQTNSNEKKNRLKFWKEFKDYLTDPTNTIPAAPFEDLISKQKDFLPFPMFGALGSHGMAAGNTFKEAVVQAISEIFERYCQKQIVDLQLSPPRISFCTLREKFPNIARYISMIEKQDELNVEIRDCSLGMNFPVFCICITNKTTHCYSVTFGSSPNIAVALERLFTEVFQGRTLKDISNRIGAPSLPEPYNTKLLFKISMGNYPAKFWDETPSYQVNYNLLDQHFYNNEDAYNYFISFCKSKKMKIYVRDASYLGFPVVHVIIPGYSEVLCCNRFVLNHKETQKNVNKLLIHYDELCKREKEFIMHFLDFNRKIGLIDFIKKENIIDPLSNLHDNDILLLLLAQIAADLCNFNKAKYFYFKLSNNKREEFLFLADYYEFLSQNVEIPVVLSLLKRFYKSDTFYKSHKYLKLSPSKMINNKNNKLQSVVLPIIDKLCCKAQKFYIDERE